MNKVERLARLDASLVYICLDSRRTFSPQHDMTACLAIAESALQGGVSIVQLRDKESLAERTLGVLTPAETVAFCQALKEICHAQGGLFAVNDDPYLAATVQADICHVGQDDMPVSQVRDIVGDEMLIGQSTHSVTEALGAAADALIDYFCIGPIWATPTKPGRAAIGLATIQEFCQLNTSTKPWFAIGGIDLTNIIAVCQAGAHKCVMVRAIIDAEDPSYSARQAITQMKQALPNLSAL